MLNLLCLSFTVSAAFAVTGAPAPQGFFCNMNALSADERAALPGIFDHLIAAKPQVEELAEGYELTFKNSKGLFTYATRWSSAENRCCPFFDFVLTVKRYDGPMTVRITGPAGVKAFIFEDLPRLHRLTTPASKG